MQISKPCFTLLALSNSEIKLSLCSSVTLCMALETFVFMFIISLILRAHQCMSRVCLCVSFSHLHPTEMIITMTRTAAQMTGQSKFMSPNLCLNLLTYLNRDTST